MSKFVLDKPLTGEQKEILDRLIEKTARLKDDLEVLEKESMQLFPNNYEIRDDGECCERRVYDTLEDELGSLLNFKSQGGWGHVENTEEEKKKWEMFLDNRPYLKVATPFLNSTPRVTVDSGTTQSYRQLVAGAFEAGEKLVQQHNVTPDPHKEKE